MRLPGDVVFIIGGTLPFMWICWLGVRYRMRESTYELPENALFTEENPEADTEDPVRV